MPGERIVNEKNIVATWDDAHRYSPAPRHRRRLILKLLKSLDFADCLDAGCAQPFLLEEITRRFNVPGCGCDISDKVMAESQMKFPHLQFLPLDLTQQRWPNERQFDLVVCSEVLEHIPAWPTVLHNLVKMTRKHLLITVPSGKIRAMDKMVGHHQHFQGPELRAELERNGCEVVKLFKWGFPVHALYKRMISNVAPETLYGQFAEGSYGPFKKVVSELLYAGFYFNQFDAGDQLFALARKSAEARAA